MKKVLVLIMAAAMLVVAFAGCQPKSETSEATTTTKGPEVSSEESQESTETEPEESKGPVKVIISLADSSSYYIGTMVGETVKTAFEEAGAEVTVLDAASQVNTQIEQIQNAVTAGADIIYVFPAGDAEAYNEPLTEAREAGVKVIVSHNDPGESAYDAYVGSEEFYMGAMQALAASEWIDKTLPDAEQVKILVLESHFNETMAHRCLGMRLIGEKFVRKADIETMYFVKEDGEPVQYKDADGNVMDVEEPTGGLILDSEGYAMLNPFYNEKAVLIEDSDRVATAIDAALSQNALEAAVTKGNDDIQIVMVYGDVGLAVSEKMIELVNAGSLNSDLSSVAVFCSDATDSNITAIGQSADNTTVLRGVMAAGDLIATLSDFAGKMVAGEEVTRYTMEPLSYYALDDSGEVAQVFYSDVMPIPAEIAQIFE